jgi:4-amino-4-deoxy-L-arabinose transferase-like glycosyltransferase
LIGFLVGLAVLDLLVLTAGPVGVTWDEPIYSEAAERVARWLGIVARGDLAQAFDPYAFGISWGLVNEHPPLVRVLNGLGWALTRNVLPVPTSHRVGTMALAALAIGMLVAVTGRQRGLGASLFAGAAVLAMPRLFFHAHLGALDFPHAATWLLATLGFYRAMQSPRWWSPLLIGLGLGLALLTKINAVLLVPFWGIWLLAYR